MVYWFLTCCINHYTKLVLFHHLFSLSVFLSLSLPPCLSELKQHFWSMFLYHVPQKTSATQTTFQYTQMSPFLCKPGWSPVSTIPDPSCPALYGKETGYKKDWLFPIVSAHPECSRKAGALWIYLY